MDYTQLKTAIQRYGEMLEVYHNNAGRPPLEQEAVQDSLINRLMLEMPDNALKPGNKLIE